MNKKYRRALIAGNWKMNMLPSQVRQFTEALKGSLPESKTCDIAICASFPLLPALIRSVRDCRIIPGAQDVSEHPGGAYTGQVSAEQLNDLGTKIVIVGHSERRSYFGETDHQVNAKVLALVKNGLIPIICVGESELQRQNGLTADFVSYQVKAALHGVAAENLRRCVIAYEPLWAIGTGKTATAEQAQEVCRGIRAVIRELYGARPARGVTILYGGSMNGDNARELLSMPDIDGGLIGGASLKPEEFARIIAATAESADE